MSANSAVIPAEGSEAASTLLSTAQVVVAGGQASQTYACPGGGTALFTATGGSLASLANGALDAGEVYSLTYTDCRGSAGAASLSGTTTLTVLAAGSGGTEVATTTQGITVTLPQRVLTLNGASTLSRSVVANGASTITTDRWTAAQIELTSQRNARSSRFTLSAVDLSRSITVTNGVISARSGSGTHTMNAVLPNGNVERDDGDPGRRQLRRERRADAGRVDGDAAAQPARHQRRAGHADGDRRPRPGRHRRPHLGVHQRHGRGRGGLSEGSGRRSRNIGRPPRTAALEFPRHRPARRPATRSSATPPFAARRPRSSST